MEGELYLSDLLGFAIWVQLLRMFVLSNVWSRHALSFVVTCQLGFNPKFSFTCFYVCTYNLGGSLFLWYCLGFRFPIQTSIN